MCGSDCERGRERELWRVVGMVGGKREGGKERWIGKKWRNMYMRGRKREKGREGEREGEKDVCEGVEECERE